MWLLSPSGFRIKQFVTNCVGERLPLCQLWNLHVNCTVGLKFVYTNIGTKPYIPWAQLGGGHGGCAPPTFSDSGDIICYLPHIFLGLVIYWFHTKLSPSHFATKLRSCYIYSFYYMLSHSIVWHLLRVVYNILNMQRFMPHQ